MYCSVFILSLLDAAFTPIAPCPYFCFPKRGCADMHYVPLYCFHISCCLIIKVGIFLCSSPNLTLPVGTPGLSCSHHCVISTQKHGSVGFRSQNQPMMAQRSLRIVACGDALLQSQGSEAESKVQGQGDFKLIWARQ